MECVLLLLLKEMRFFAKRFKVQQRLDLNCNFNWRFERYAVFYLYSFKFNVQQW